MNFSVQSADLDVGRVRSDDSDDWAIGQRCFAFAHGTGHAIIRRLISLMSLITFFMLLLARSSAVAERPCLYLVPFLRYSASKNGVSLKPGGVIENKVIENGAVR